MTTTRKNITLEKENEEILLKVSKELLGREDLSALMDYFAARIRQDKGIENMKALINAIDSFMVEIFYTTSSGVRMSTILEKEHAHDRVIQLKSEGCTITAIMRF